MLSLKRYTFSWAHRNERLDELRTALAYQHRRLDDIRDRVSKREVGAGPLQERSQGFGPQTSKEQP